MGGVAKSIGGAVGGIVGGLTGSTKASNAAGQAAQTQAASSQAGIDEQRRQFNAIMQMMSPYLQAGNSAIGQQQGLLGLQGADAQQGAINNLMQGPLYQTMLDQGQNALLQNASATGGLRGGNTQAALAQLSPNILAQVYQNQLSNLGGLSQLGQSSAGLQANAGQASAANIGNLLNQQGAALAGGQIAKGNTQSNSFNSLMSLGGLAAAFL